MAAGNAIASGAVILTANADGLANGLQRSQTSVIDWGNKSAVEATKATEKIGKQVEQGFEHTQSKLNKAFGKFAKHEGGFLGSIGGGALQDFGLGGTAAIVVGIGLALRQVTKNTEEVTEAVRKWELKMASIAKLSDRASEKSAEWRAAFTDIANPLEGRVSIEKDITRLQRERRDHEATAEAARKKIADLKAFGPSAASRWLLGEQADTISPIKKILTDSEAAALAVTDKLAGLHVQLERVMDRAKDPAFVGAINKATTAVLEQIETWGLDAVAAQRALFIMHGGTDKLLEGLDAANKKAKELAEGNSLQPWMKTALSFTNAIGPFLKEQDAPPWMVQALHLAAAIGKEFEHLNQWEKKTFDPGFMTMLQILAATAQGLTAGASFDLSKLINPKKLESEKFAGAALKGSLEDYTLTVRNKFDSDVMKAEKDKTADAVKESNKRLDKALDKLDDLNKGVRDWGVI